MLTVKSIQPGGTEYVVATSRAEYVPPVPHPDGTTTAHTMWIEEFDGRMKCLGSWGAFYVMNDRGSTVAKYDLGGWSNEPVPVGAPPLSRDDGIGGVALAEAA